MKFIPFSFLFCFFCLFQSVSANQIQWAAELEFQHNQFAEHYWGGKQVLGAPNSEPFGYANSKAFRLNSQAAFGTLIVSFREPQHARQIVIMESYLPGRISDIALYDENGRKYNIYKGSPTILKQNYRTLCISLERTTYKIKKLELNINTTIKTGWSQIDAIGLSDEPDDVQFEKMMKTLGLGNLHYEFPFASLKENLGQNINTKFSEIKPMISPDGRTLYFSRQNYPGNYNGRTDPQDIYYSNFESGQWTKAKNLGEPLNNEFPNGVSTVSADGKQLLLINLYRKRGGEIAGASLSKRSGNGWSYPQMIVIEEYYNYSQYADFYLSNNGKVLLMAIDRDDSNGDQDLYASFLISGNRWSKPVNLGETINTSEPEFSPFLAADEKTLYFASRGHGGFGESDIFYTKRLDDSWVKWSKPKNLGLGVNSVDWDAYYSIPASGEYAYFVHGKGTSRDPKNIYRIALPREFKPEPVLLVKGRVYDSQTKEPLSANIQFETEDRSGKSGNVQSDSKDGSYSMILTRGSKFIFITNSDGYVPLSENIDLSEMTEYREIEKDLYLDPIQTLYGQIVRSIYFEKGSVEILSYDDLERLLAILKQYPELRVELGGHTDNLGSSHLKMQLSEDRVEAIRKYLISNDIDDNRIETKAYGGTRPVSSNEFEESRKLNRRVEIKFLNK
ncbi:OmpA family protein [Fulvivirgaceae bacterium BMA10]|uniref:OmpA family protein n=1 Tax=Splendidivirga corallicola TaxID=3051826 RepID=A0ABT8KND5_9BACT|nr:OmpA family protein [Fulvivirgaceae bacterium BMA10]